ncbi:Leucine Rich repeats (2 copies) [Symmachiella dynata]|uniref:Leucine Rich repeats (2 copies) n=2 Tax=Symmachiella dynata TaxID=2527995 RepID=A0A517ZIP8_9PLAN|nr:Leucine Rich repeats (2 copies) [Symmachiella dynata]
MFGKIVVCRTLVTTPRGHIAGSIAPIVAGLFGIARLVVLKWTGETGCTENDYRPLSHAQCDLSVTVFPCFNAGPTIMFNKFSLPSKKLVTVVATIGLAGFAGVCGCQHAEKETAGCCQVCAPAAEQQAPAAIAEADQQLSTGPVQLDEPYAAPPVDPPTAAPMDPQTQAEPAVTSQELATRFESLGGTVELDSTQDISVLDLSGTIVGDDDLRNGAGLENLTQLDLSETTITDAAFAHPHWMSNLTRLSLNGTSLTDAGLQNLKNLNRLQLLWMNETAVGDAGLAQIAELNGLQSLGLNKTEVTDAGLAHLRNMKDLKYLLLGHTQITDAGLQHLRGFDKLKGLSLVGTRVTPVGIAELQVALPNCRIVADPVDATEEATEDTTEDATDNADEQPNALEPGLESGEARRQMNTNGRQIRQAVSMATPHMPLPARRFPGLMQRGAVQSNSGVDITRYYMAVALAETGNMRAALPMFAETVGEAAAYFNVGVMLCKAGYWKQGEAQLHYALQLDPRMSSARHWLNEIARERNTVMPQPNPQQIQRTQWIKPVQVRSDRRTDISPPPIGVWTKLPNR